MPSNCFIYALVDPVSHRIRYIGRSKVGLDRPKSHAHPAVLARNKQHSGNWIRLLKKQGLSYVISILEYTTLDKLDEREIWWIAYGRTQGWPLTNHAIGGRGSKGVKPSAEARAKRSAALKGRTHNADSKKLISSEMKKVWARKGETERKSKGLFFKNWNANPNNLQRRIDSIKASYTEELRLKARARMKTAWSDPDLRARMSAGRRERQLGKLLTQETKDKIAAKARERYRRLREQM